MATFPSGKRIFPLLEEKSWSVGLVLGAQGKHPAQTLLFFSAYCEALRFIGSHLLRRIMCYKSWTHNPSIWRENAVQLKTCNSAYKIPFFILSPGLICMFTGQYRVRKRSSLSLLQKVRTINQLYIKLFFYIILDIHFWHSNVRNTSVAYISKRRSTISFKLSFSLFFLWSIK